MRRKALRDVAGLALVLSCRLSAARAQEATELIYELDLERVVDRKGAAKDIREVLAKRLHERRIDGVAIDLLGENHLVIRVPEKHAAAVREVRGQVEGAGNLAFHIVAQDQSPARIEKYEKEWQAYVKKDREWVAKKRAEPTLAERRPQPPRYIVRSEPAKEGQRILENFHTIYDDKTHSWTPDGIISGRHLERAEPTMDPATFKPAIGFRFGREGTAQLRQVTENNKGRELAIVLDEDILQIAVIRDVITGSGQLTGNFSDEDVKRIISTLRGGSLVARPRLISERKVEAGE